ncbi:hypothetical protein J6590_106843, partial [Homalodisca vitripennis]
ALKDRPIVSPLTGHESSFLFSLWCPQLTSHSGPIITSSVQETCSSQVMEIKERKEKGIPTGLIDKSPKP